MMQQFMAGALLMGAVLVGGVGRAQSQRAEAAGERVVWPLKSVTVYQQGAWLSHGGQVVGAASPVEVIVGGIDSSAIPSTLEVLLPAGWELIGSQFKRAPVAAERLKHQQALDRLQAELDANRAERAKEDALLQAFEEELAMLRANRAFGGDEAVLVEDLREMSDFWRNRVQEIALLSLDVRSQIAMLDAEHARKRSDWNALQGKVLEMEGTIHLQIQAPKGASGSVELGYLSPGAHWAPRYAVRWRDAGLLELERSAEVRQSTGIDWSGIPVRFAAGTPLGANRRVVTVTFTDEASKGEEGMDLEEDMQLQMLDGQLDRIQEVRIERIRGVSTVSAAETSVSVNASPLGLSAMGANVPMDATGGVRGVWNPGRPVTVPTGDTLHRVLVDRLSLPAVMTYGADPAQGPEAQRRIRVADWAAHNLIPGHMEMRVEDLYVGSGRLELPVESDSLTVSLGRDADVRVQRTTLQQETHNRRWVRRQKHHIVYRYDAANLKDVPVNLQVEDILTPDFLNAYSSFRIEVREAAGGEWMQARNLMRWSLALPAGGSQRWEVRLVVHQPG